MARFIICVLVIVTVVAGHGHKHNPRFPKEDFGLQLRTKGDYRKVACTVENLRERDKIIEQAKCGPPKDVFVPLEPKAAHEQVTPGSVWVKRCVGLCEFDNAGSCVATETVIRHIPIRIFNAKTNKETCATYPVEEHVSCQCCPLGPEGCPAPRVINPRKCTCQCPNLEERRNCIKKRNQRWNRSKCTCEERRRFRV